MAKEKKRKREGDHQPANGSAGAPDLDTSKPSAVFAPTGGRSYTLSVALPGSVIANAKSHDQKTHLAGTVARALAVFCVDEVVVFNDGDHAPPTAQQPGSEEYTAFSDPDHFLAHLLSYLETPPYLRKTLFSMHPNLRTAGTLPSLDMPHHLRATEWCEYREGVSTRTTNDGTYVDAGLPKHQLVEGAQIPPNTRVTMKLDQQADTADAVAPSEPREAAGYYWGYTVRRASSLSSVLTECPFDGGYDVSFGTSERGAPLSTTLETALPEFKHMLVVLGGVGGLETAAAHDGELATMGIAKTNVAELFDYWVNVLPAQGSRTIRTEEAVWLSLMGLSGVVAGNGSKG